MTRRSLARGPGVAWPGCYEAGWVAATGTQLAGTGNRERGTGNWEPGTGNWEPRPSFGTTATPRVARDDTCSFACRLPPVHRRPSPVVRPRQSPVACRLVFRHLPTS